MTELSEKGTAEETADGSRTEARGENSGKEMLKIAMTFDDGPSVYTEQLLDGLKEREVKAAFFLIGRSA